MNKQRAMRLVRPLSALAGLLLIIAWMAGAFHERIEPAVHAAASRSVPTTAATVLLRRVPAEVVEVASGTVRAERKTTVASRILASVSKMTKDSGDSVRRGEVLAVLDDRDLAARVHEARGAAEAAEAVARQRAGDHARARQLLSEGVLSRGEFDRSEAVTRVAQADAERLRQAVRAAEVALSYATVVSPVAGRVVERLADPGDTVAPGTPLMTLYDPSALRIEVPVRESLGATLAVGQALRVTVGRQTVVLEGRIDEIVPQAEVGSRTFLVKVGLPPRDGLYTGMFGRVSIPAGQRDRTSIAGSAVIRIGQLTYVDVVDGEALHRRLITLGRELDDGTYEVLSGVRAGERVLLHED